ncbi:ubiquinol-cytochrome c reductase iron-sulfur subunit [Nocardia sp. NPDC051570]|uniref:ubiquinol-cytochrome c reductase iron-sulfur subunit n=1 Tax=Nocardia sp. NPDC051570 TaxID=3364324 RepID=UPI0037B9D689
MNRAIRRYVEELLAGRRPHAFRPDDAEAEQMRAAIALRSARPGAQAPSEEFLTGLGRRLAGEIGESTATPAESGPSTRRRQVLVGTSVAAAAAAAGAIVDRTLLETSKGEPTPPAAQQDLVPTNGAWRAIAAASAVPEGVTVAFDVGAVRGFVHRRNGIAYALSGICTHQGCKLWLDAPADRLRCPCHSTSFGTDGQVVTHQLPIAPAPLPHLRTREIDGAIEVFAPTEPA